MKKVYSIILLFTFIVGTLQPVIPMIEYQLFAGNIVEVLAGDTCSQQKSCKITQCMTGGDCPICNSSKDQQLLDTDFYPLALEIVAVHDSRTFLISERIYLPEAKHVMGPVLLSQSPPPRMS